MKKLFIFLICLPSFCYAGSMNMIGQKGKISEVDRVIEIKMYDNYFTPSKLEISKNETIKFVVHNVGDLVHELILLQKICILSINLRWLSW